MSNRNKKPMRVEIEDVAEIAQQGVARALEARKAAGIELTQDEIDQINGGAYTSTSFSSLSLRQLINIGVIAGGIWGPIDGLGGVTQGQLR